MPNYVSLIKNCEQSYVSCRKSNIIKKTNEIYVTDDNELEVELKIKKVGKTNECVTTVKNISQKQVDMNQISSAFLEVENNGKLLWSDENKYRIYFCRSSWACEGQWQTTTLSDMGLYRVPDGQLHPYYASIASRGSWSTGKFYPLVMVEDLELGETHYFEVMSSSAWYIEFCMEYNEKNEERLFVFMSGTCEKNDGWHKILNPQEKYGSLPAIYGTVKGGFEEAIKELTDYKRLTSKVDLKNTLPPVCYNDYMNCCWGQPSTERNIPLIDKAAELGVEVFCMDDGWQVSLFDDDVRCVGDWGIAKQRFLPLTFKGIIDYARNKGLKFGAWLEIESVDEKSEAYQKYNHYFLRRRGNIIGNRRTFYDFRSDIVCEKLEKVFDMLYELGVRYIKNDYNHSVGIGCDGADSLSEGVIENTKAFCAFIDKIRVKYPDLIIENCGSGAMRSDTGMLSHFHLQSTSDQWVYIYNPSIVSGSLACMPPEKAGIWSYPYPIRMIDRDVYAITDEDKKEYSDGKQTIFNMVNSMMGIMYLSGRTDACDELNYMLIKEAIDVYKTFREDIPKSYPIYPNGTFRINERGVFCLGLSVPEKNRIYLAVWKINSDENVSKIDLSKYGKIESVTKLYPSIRDYSVNAVCDKLTVNLPDGNTAMLVSIEMKK